MSLITLSKRNQAQESRYRMISFTRSSIQTMRICDDESQSGNLWSEVVLDGGSIRELSGIIKIF